MGDETGRPKGETSRDASAPGATGKGIEMASDERSLRLGFEHEHDLPAFSHEQIERRAYEIFLARGGEPGHDLEDWLRAERELIEEAQKAAAEGRG